MLRAARPGLGALITFVLCKSPHTQEEANDHMGGELVYFLSQVTNVFRVKSKVQP